MGWVSGHDASNDDLFTPQEDVKAKEDAYNYGGHTQNAAGDDTTQPGAYAQAEASRFQGLANTARNQAAPTTDYGQANQDRQGFYNDRENTHADRDLAGKARAQEEAALTAQKDAAMGRGTSVAASQLQYGMGQAQAAQASLAASARGGGANLAAAQRQAAMQGAGIAAQTNQQAAILRAQEIAQARSAWQQGASGIRGQDQTQQGADIGQQGQDLTARGQSAQESQFKTDAELKQRGLNAATGLGYEGLGMDVNKTQMGGAQAQQAAEAGHWATQAGLDQHSEDKQWDNTYAGLGAIGSDMSTKKNVHGADGVAGRAIEGAAAQALGASPAISFNYKEGNGNRVLGTSANALEATPYGSQVVQRGKDGKRQINIPGATSMLLAAGSDQEKRLRALEAQQGGAQPGGGMEYGGRKPSPYAKPGPYVTQLSPAEESAFQSWVKKDHIPWRDAPTADYDMRGFFHAMTSGDPGAKRDPKNQHFPDTYKTPYHESFSNESRYATPGAPHWEGDKLVPASAQQKLDADYAAHADGKIRSGAELGPGHGEMVGTLQGRPMYRYGNHVSMSAPPTVTQMTEPPPPEQPLAYGPARGGR